MTATCEQHGITVEPVLHLAFELGNAGWKLAFSTGMGQAPRLRSIAANDLAALQVEIAKARRRFRLPETCPVSSCYEAGRDGFWLHRWLLAQGIDNVVADSSSIEVNRRQRRAKSDGLDVGKLLGLLLRYRAGERKVWSLVRVPSVADEDGRQLHRDLEELKDERTRHVNRIKGLLVSQGVRLEVTPKLVADLAAVRLWDGSPLPVELHARIVREFERWQFVQQQVLAVERLRRQRIRDDATPHVEPVRRLLELGGVGLNGSWLLVRELFGWRQPRNRRQLGALVGLTPTPYQSGDRHREQGISKSGNRRLRRLMVELAWCWVRWQPSSGLSQWFAQRFARGGPRSRKVGIVALARKLLIALWRYLEHGEVPAGARLCDWRGKL
jgi:transposase